MPTDPSHVDSRGQNYLDIARAARPTVGLGPEPDRKNFDHWLAWQRATRQAPAYLERAWFDFPVDQQAAVRDLIPLAREIISCSVQFDVTGLKNNPVVMASGSDGGNQIAFGFIANKLVTPEQLPILGINKPTWASNTGNSFQHNIVGEHPRSNFLFAQKIPKTDGVAIQYFCRVEKDTRAGNDCNMTINCPIDLARKIIYRVTNGQTEVDKGNPMVMEYLLKMIFQGVFASNPDDRNYTRRCLADDLILWNLIEENDLSDVNKGKDNRYRKPKIQVFKYPKPVGESSKYSPEYYRSQL